MVDVRDQHFSDAAIFSQRFHKNDHYEDHKMSFKFSLSHDTNLF